jgi:hypothetical protein
VVFELQGLNLRLVVGSLLVSDAGGENRDVGRGFVRDSTAFIFTNSGAAAAGGFGGWGAARTAWPRAACGRGCP